MILPEVLYGAEYIIFFSKKRVGKTKMLRKIHSPIIKERMYKRRKKEDSQKLGKKITL